MVISAVNIFFSFRAGFILADEAPQESQKQAGIYRLEGLRLQKSGNVEEALSFFQKAIDADPGMAAAYNDTGIIYETMDSPELAEKAYLDAIKLDQEFSGPYSNLALFYESQGQMDKAVSYWAKRAEMGPDEDPWKKKAIDRRDELIKSAPELKDKLLEAEESELRDKIIRERKQLKHEE